MTNTLCNGKVKNNNPKSPIRYFEIVTVREFSDYEGGTIIEQINSVEEFLNTDEEAIDEPFYHIYGITNESTIMIGEFYSIDKAKNFLYNLTGEFPDIISY